jgi:DNA mismatch endonuclease (patch repair protein)
MVDTISKEKRSFVMRSIKSSGTKPETKYHKILKRLNIRHRMHPRMFGHPDALIYPSTVAFVNGCFWHGCRKHFKLPRSNTDFWKKKIHNNTIRQNRVIRHYLKENYTVVIVWEHDLR